MSVQINTADALDEVRELIATLETHIAEVRRTNELADPDALRAQVLSEMTLNALDITLRQIEKSQEMKGKSLSRIASWRRRALAISTAPAKPYPLEEEERWIGLEAAQSGSGFR